MAVPAPSNDLPRPFEIIKLSNVAIITGPEATAILVYLTSELNAAGKIYDCPKCGGLGYHSNQVDDPSSPDNYPIRCTMGVVQPIYIADPTVQCLGWGKLPLTLKYQIDPTIVTT